MEKEKRTFSGDGSGPDPESGPLDLAYLNLVKLKQGTVVNGRYRLETLIGQGGFGIVFEAFDLTLGSRVAVKFLNPNLTGNKKKFLRVKREINLSRKISDGRIIKVFSLENWREIHFLVMELAAGRSLKSLLEEKGRLGWPEFKGIFLEIVEAVEILHCNGIVHRDLKPANILIDSERQIKILDFGLAKEVDDTEKTSTVGEIVGSPYYMSPEQIRGGEIGFPSDVYQLGLLLYRTLSGRHPFEHTSTMEVIFKQLNQRPERLAPLESGLPRFLRVGMEKALEKAPSRRFRDAGAMAHFFKKEKLSWLHQLLFSVARGPIKWGLAVLALAALLLFTYFATFGSRVVHDLRPQGGILEARNRLGVRLWRKDFSPFTVYDAYQTKSMASLPLGTGISSEYLSQDLGDKRIVAALLIPPSHVVFPAEQSIVSAAWICQRAIVDPGGKILKREPLLADYEYDAYDYIKVIKPHTVQRLGVTREGETETLFTVQQYQSMYPTAMVFGRGLSKYVFTHPGTFAVTPLGSAGDRSSFMLFGINNLFAHMSFVAEITFNTSGGPGSLIKGIPNFSPDMRNNVPHEDKLFILPFRARLIENRWQEEGRARFSEDTLGNILEINRDGRMEVQTRSGALSYRDAHDVLRRVYTLVNASFQEKVVKHNPENALALVLQAASFPLQNPYLRSALFYLQGDLEIELGRYADGERTLQQALAVFPGNNDACERLCEMEMLKGDPQAALRRLADARSDSSEFWGFSSFGVQLFKGYLCLHSGMFSQAEAEFDRIRVRVPDLATFCQAMDELFGGNYAAALAALRELEKQPLGAVDMRELRLMLGRSMLLSLKDLERARFLFDDISRNSLVFGHLAELSSCFFLAREGRTAEAGKAAREAFARLQARARGDFMTRIWLFYDAYVYGRTMEMAHDRTEAARGYRTCLQANPHTELAERSRQQLAFLARPH